MIINPATSPPDDPATRQPVTRCEERIGLFLEALRPTDTLIVATPVLAEVLVRAGAGAPEVLAEIATAARIKVRPFGQKAAVELAIMTLDAIRAGDKRGGSDQAWQKVKFDRQIAAVARSEGAELLFADDLGLVRFAQLLGMNVQSTWNLPLPHQSQPDLFRGK